MAGAGPAGGAKARLLPENATDPEDYAWAARLIRDELGIDPEPPARP